MLIMIFILTLLVLMFITIIVIITKILKDTIDINAKIDAILRSTGQIHGLIEVLLDFIKDIKK